MREVLAEYGEITRDALGKYLEHEARRDAVYGLAADYPLRGGRALRASFCIAAARAFGAPVRDAVRSAVSLELMHNAFLVHDDVEDESEERRGKPTLHELHGVPIAVNAGDALVVLALGPLLGNRATLGARVAWRVLEETERMVRESVEGQALELDWRRNNRLSLGDSDYLRMTLKKTCWYTTIYPSRIGALIGARERVNLDLFVRFGFFLGAAFQIQDDLLNLTGDHESYGKELDGDLREGKRTLMLLHLVRNASDAERARIARLFEAPRREKSDSELSWLSGRLRQQESIQYARRVAHALAGAASHEFGVAYAKAPPSRDKSFIEALPYWVLERA